MFGWPQFAQGKLCEKRREGNGWWLTIAATPKSQDPPTAAKGGERPSLMIPELLEAVSSSSLPVVCRSVPPWAARASIRFVRHHPPSPSTCKGLYFLSIVPHHNLRPVAMARHTKHSHRNPRPVHQFLADEYLRSALLSRLAMGMAESYHTRQLWR